MNIWMGISLWIYNAEQSIWAPRLLSLKFSKANFTNCMSIVSTDNWSQATHMAVRKFNITQKASRLLFLYNYCCFFGKKCTEKPFGLKDAMTFGIEG